MGMDSSSAQDHHQEMGSQTLESMLGCTITQQEKKPRPSEQSLKCPRCDSTNTKFCYYNNYSLSQPRYFCKSCRRYWTKGGTLRNVPVGGGCRKNKRSSSSSSSSSTNSLSKKPHDHQITTIPIPSLSYDSNDLSLAIARLQKQSNGGHMGMDGHDHFSILGQHNNMAHVGNNSGYFVENSNGLFQNMYYGMGVNGINQDLGMGFDQEFNGGTSAISTAVTTVKQEGFGSGREGGENGVLWSFPWKNFEGSGNSNNNNNIGEIDSGRVSNWSNGIGLSSNWHGLLNSPLM